MDWKRNWKNAKEKETNKRKSRIWWFRLRWGQLVISSSDKIIILYKIQTIPFTDGYDSDYMGDEKDREKMESMPEAEREKIIIERRERRDILKKRYEIEKVFIVDELSPFIPFLDHSKSGKRRR